MDDRTLELRQAHDSIAEIYVAAAACSRRATSSPRSADARPDASLPASRYRSRIGSWGSCGSGDADGASCSRQQPEGVHVRRPHNGEVAVVQGGDLGDAHALGGRDDRRVYGAER